MHRSAQLKNVPPHRAFGRFVFALSFLLVLGACAGHGGEGGGQSVRSAKLGDWSGTVTRVTDGDTLSIAPVSGAPRKVRIDGIDAPESCQTGGAAAGAALHRKVMGQRVQVATRALDMYQRELATVRLDGQDVGAWLVEHGHAWSYRYRGDNGPYLREEQRARRATRGVFADRRAMNPREFRQTHGPC